MLKKSLLVVWKFPAIDRLADYPIDFVLMDLLPFFKLFFQNKTQAPVIM